MKFNRYFMPLVVLLCILPFFSCSTNIDMPPPPPPDTSSSSSSLGENNSCSSSFSENGSSSSSQQWYNSSSSLGSGGGSSSSSSLSGQHGSSSSLGGGSNDDEAIYCSEATKIITLSGNGNGDANTVDAVCFKKAGNIVGWTCSNAQGRTCKVNGGSEIPSQDQNISGSGSTAINGYVYINCSKGDAAWFSIAVW